MFQFIQKPYHFQEIQIGNLRFAKDKRLTTVNHHINIKLTALLEHIYSVIICHRSFII